MDRFRSELRFAIRLLARRPGFTATVVGVMALGIGVSTAVFTVVDHVLFRPLDLPNSERIVTICQTQTQGQQWCGASPPNAEDWSHRSRTLSVIGIGRSEVMALRGDDGTQNVNVGIATAGFLRAYGFEPLMGRLLEPDDIPPHGDGHVIVLGYEFWQTILGGDPHVLGRSLTLDEEPYTVIGVLPEGASIPRLDYARAWRPLPFDPATEQYREWRGFVAVGRLASGASLAQADAEIAGIQRALVQEHPDVLAGSGAQVRRLREYLVAPARTTLLVFLGAVLLVLLIVSVNVASLLLARATARDREFVVRSALGATGGTLGRQLLIESGLLALLGGAGGVFVGYWATDAFLKLAPAGIPRLDEIHVDLRVLLFALLATGIAAVIFGLAPLFRLRGMSVADGLREGRGLAGGRATHRARRALVVAQLALALMLLVGGGLLFRSFASLLAWQPGFETQHVLTFQLFPGSGRYPHADQVLSLYRRAESALRALPGVRSVGTTSAGPLFGGGDGTTPFQVEGRPTVSLDQAPTVAWYDVGPDYFPTLGIQLRSGRLLAETDAAGTPQVALVNAAFVRRYWPDGSPIGTRLSLPNLERTVEIVGVVGDIQPFDPEQRPEPELYLSNRQYTRWATFFVLRTESDPTTLAGPATAALASLDPELTPSRIATLPELAARSRRGPQFNLALVGLFAAVALILSIVGMYGVMAYTVALRTHEIGIRMALGADGSRVLRWVGAEGVRIVVVSVVLGSAGAVAFSRLLRGMLHGVPPTDPGVFTVTISLLVVAALAACFIPAARASRIAPTVAIREE